MNYLTEIGELTKKNELNLEQLQATVDENTHLREKEVVLNNRILHLQQSVLAAERNASKAENKNLVLVEANALLTAKLELADVKASHQQLIKDLLAVEYIFPILFVTDETGTCPMDFKERDWREENLRIRQCKAKRALHDAEEGDAVPPPLESEVEKVKKQIEKLREEHSKVKLFLDDTEILENERDRSSPTRIVALMEENMVVKANWEQHWLRREQHHSDYTSEEEWRRAFRMMRRKRMESLMRRDRSEGGGRDLRSINEDYRRRLAEESPQHRMDEGGVRASARGLRAGIQRYERMRMEHGSAESEDSDAPPSKLELEAPVSEKSAEDRPLTEREKKQRKKQRQKARKEKAGKGKGKKPKGQGRIVGQDLGITQ